MLSGVRVLDCCDESGFLAGKILAELGADVVKLEPPGGDRAGRRAPYLGGIVDPERSLAWLALNTGKRGITLDVERASGRAAFARLLGWADVLLETFAPGTLASWGLGDDELARRHPRLVRCAITPFGQTGPYAGFRASDLVVVAMAGGAVRSGDPGRPPVRCTMPLSYLHAAPEAALGIVLALHHRERTGRGQLVDVSLHECQRAALASAPPAVGLREVWQARDGWIAFAPYAGDAAPLEALVAWMHECGEAPEWLRAFEWSVFAPAHAERAEIERVEDAFARFFAARPARALHEGAQARGLALAACHDASDVLAQAPLRAHFTTIDYPALGASIEHPACFARPGDGALAVRSRAPRVGEHNDAVYREAGFEAEEIEKLAAEGAL